jgi:hypothetical protein
VEIGVGCKQIFLGNIAKFLSQKLVHRYGRLMSVECNWPRIYTLSRYLYAILGALELIFLVALSVVGEREFICEII